MATDKPRFPITIEPETAEIIEKYRHEHKIKSTSKATVELLLLGIEEFYGTQKGLAVDPVTDAIEALLLKRFRELNEDGRTKAVEYLDDLVQSGKYKKGAPAANNGEKSRVG